MQESEKKLIRIEEKIEIILEKLADLVSDQHGNLKKIDDIGNRLIQLEVAFKEIKWKEVSEIDKRLSHIEKLQGSLWRIFEPVISTCIGGLIVWIFTMMSRKGL